MTSARVTCTPWIRELGAATPAPGGGAAAGMMVALGASLTQMVAGYSSGSAPGPAPSPLVAARMEGIAAEAGMLAERALAAADADAVASQGFAAAFRLPDDAARPAAIAAATRAAARASDDLGDLALRALDLLTSLGEEANPIVLADVAVAAAALGGALRAAAVNVEVNLQAGSDAVTAPADVATTGHPGADHPGVAPDAAAEAAASGAAHRTGLRRAVVSFDSAAVRADALVVAIRSAIASSGT